MTQCHQNNLQKESQRPSQVENTHNSHLFSCNLWSWMLTCNEKSSAQTRIYGKEDDAVNLQNHEFWQHSKRRYGIAPTAEKLWEARLRWYGCSLRAEEKTIVKLILCLEVNRKRAKGRPKSRRSDILYNNLKATGLHPEPSPNLKQVKRVIQDSGPLYMRKTLKKKKRFTEQFY